MTAYEYDGADRMTKLTGPGNKNWTYWYNALGQPVEVLLPNGMMTVYDYDEDHQHRMTKISHKNSPVGSVPRRVWADTQVRPYGVDKPRVPVVRIRTWPRWACHAPLIPLPPGEGRESPLAPAANCA